MCVTRAARNAIVGIALVVAFIAYDVYLGLDGVRGNTWSELARAGAGVTPAIAWAWGVLAGHFFHPTWKPRPRVGLLLWLTFVVVVVGIACKHGGVTLPFWAPLAPGFFAGWLLWPV